MNSLVSNAVSRNLVQAVIGWLERHPQKSILSICFIFALTASGRFYAIGLGALFCLLIYPVINNCRGLTDKEQLQYLKAYGKTKNAQRSILLLGSIIFVSGVRSISSQQGLSCYGPHFALLQGFSLDWLFASPVIYGLCFCLSSLGQSLAARNWAVLPGFDRASSCVRYLLFMAAFLTAVSVVCHAFHGPIDWLGNWLISSALDANLPGMHDFFQARICIFSEHRFVSFASSAALWLQGLRDFSTIAMSILLWSQGSRLAIFLSNFSRHFAANPSRAGLIDSYIQTLADSSIQITLNDGHNWLVNIIRSVLWLSICYLFLLWFFGLSTGPIGAATTNMIMDNYFKVGYPAVYLDEIPRLRLFFAAIYALYGTVPLAVTSCVFFPTGKTRSISLSEDGITAPSGSGLDWLFMPFRPWSDLLSVGLAHKDNENTTEAHGDFKKNALTIKFVSGGTLKVPLAKLTAGLADTLIGTIDERADNCLISPGLSALRRHIQPLLKQGDRTNNVDGVSTTNNTKVNFKSTLFVPKAPGDCLQFPCGLAVTNTVRIVRLLDTWPLSTVYLARMNNGNLVVVKHFYLAGTDINNDDKNLQATKTAVPQSIFKKENEILSHLDHPDIAKVLSIVEENDSSFLILQHWKGDDLRSFIDKRGPLKEKEVINFARQISQIMQYLHSRSTPILHRDLSPDNFILDQSGRLKLIDFGSTKEILAGMTGSLIGKQNYIAPEQIRGEAGIKSDIYAFGCILHYLLTGKDPRPLSQSSPAEHTDTAAWLDIFVRSCTAFDAQERPDNFDDIALLLARASLDGTAQLKILALHLNTRTAAKQKAFAPPAVPEETVKRLSTVQHGENVDCPVYPSFMLTLKQINRAAELPEFALVKTSVKQSEVAL